MTVDIVKAAVDIHMTDEQQHQFNDAVAEFVSSHFAMIQKELKKEAPDLEQRVKSRDGVSGTPDGYAGAPDTNDRAMARVRELQESAAYAIEGNAVAARFQ